MVCRGWLVTLRSRARSSNRGGGLPARSVRAANHRLIAESVRLIVAACVRVIQSCKVPEFRWTHTHVALEQEGKMALVGEAADQSNFGERRTGVSQQLT